MLSKPYLSITNQNLRKLKRGFVSQKTLFRDPFILFDLRKTKFVFAKTLF